VVNWRQASVGIFGLPLVIKKHFHPGEETEFRAELMRTLNAHEKSLAQAYAVENEEKEPGWPDVLVAQVTFGEGTLCTFIETKVCDASGHIKFEKTQPVFYKRNPILDVQIYAFDSRYDRILVASAEDIVKEKKLRFKLPEVL